ncbi:MAG: T9SS type A sorting domain-containing protein, partial [Bacteroidales bacterium]
KTIRKPMRLLFTTIILLLSLQGYSQHSLDFVIPPCPHMGTLDPAGRTIDLVVFPNPASGTLFVKAGAANGFEKVHIRVYSVLGRLVAGPETDRHLPQISIDVSGLGSGLYLLEYSSGSTVLRKKIIIDNSLRTRE